ncbi:hypothetical protein Hanom_Chr16g01464831 [Helianthus anomalus]
MAGPRGGREGLPGRARYFEWHVFYKYPDMYMYNNFLIGYIYTNTNIGPITKLFLWFRLVINPFGIRFRPLVCQIPNFVKPKGTFFRA